MCDLQGGRSYGQMKSRPFQNLSRRPGFPAPARRMSGSGRRAEICAYRRIAACDLQGGRSSTISKLKAVRDLSRRPYTCISLATAVLNCNHPFPSGGTHSCRGAAIDSVMLGTSHNLSRVPLRVRTPLLISVPSSSKVLRSAPSALFR